MLARQAVGRAVVASLATRYTGYRRFTVLSQGGLPGPEASAGKLAGTAAARLGADAGVRLLGDDAVYAATADGDDTWQRTQAYLPGLAIAGGTDQVLRNILGERVLGLPPEPRLDKTRALPRGCPVNFDLDTDQRDAAAGAREFFTGQASAAAARDALEGGALRPGRKALADIGFLGITVPEAAGGAGGCCSTSPSSPSRAARCWPARRWSPRPARRCCWPTPPSWPRSWPTGRRRSPSSTGPDGSHPRSTPSTPPPSWPWRTARWWSARARSRPATPIDATRGLASVRLTSRRVLAEDAGELWARARQVGAVVIAAEDLGAADRAVQLGVAYAKERQAFGRPIGSYQAVKHMLVDAWVGSTSCARWCGGPPGPPTPRPTSCRSPRPRPRR